MVNNPSQRVVGTNYVRMYTYIPDLLRIGMHDFLNLSSRGLQTKDFFVVLAAYVNMLEVLYFHMIC